MNEHKEDAEKTLDFRFVLLIFQTAFFAVIVTAALIIKAFGGEFYNSVKNEYIKYFEEETDLEDVFDDREGSISFEEGYKVSIE